MCKCCQHCLESCYWNLIEEKFCFDESIALYEEPVKKTSEKNNNMFDNMAFYDSVSVIAGRAIVTIDPLEPKRNKQAQAVVVEQPRKRLKWPEKNSKDIDPDYLNKVPFIMDPKEKESTDTDGGESESQQELLQKRKLIQKCQIKKSVSFHNIPDKTASSGYETDNKSKSTNLIVPEDEEVTLRVGKSLRERRMSKSLSLKIVDMPKELPIIRQNSMPKFYLDTPDENQLKDSSIVKNCVLVLQSPMPVDCSFDLQSVVQMEKDRQSSKVKTPPVPIHRETSKLNLLKDKIMLKKSKSTINASTLPYTNHM
ncbi:uncharacterized protein LOC109543795 isoform X2 [Dendroctonus ponderosae]|uniref:uncharacterized protein LOC109543795 isoform X2 n=1 Tax=Dendroctonus ponderosae TaxID=77166 RepID=UPI002035BB95|nr:uncharacterized protein LOC109543795 isoform X2 [Dendroctonus ponderosae]KAH1015580.1 hypothetical protein HUJ05_013281 [Dendroctonus ponderosae]KAH1015581.1 hypothetical protein HUJ05_013281 [Dendroctonus ponderosae]